MTAERVEPLLALRTKMVILNSPSNPAGSRRARMPRPSTCARRGVILCSDEIYDEFAFPEFHGSARTAGPDALARASRLPSSAENHPAAHPRIREDVRRDGLAARVRRGPGADRADGRRQQYVYVRLHPLQLGAMEAFDVDISRTSPLCTGRDMVVAAFAGRSAARRGVYASSRSRCGWA